MLKPMQSQTLKETLFDYPINYFGLSLDPMGHMKFPCALSPEADCKRCEYILPLFSLILWRRRLLI